MSRSAIDNHSHLHYRLIIFQASEATMYVCVCNTVTDGEIRDAVNSGATSLLDVQSCLPVAGCCGRCAETAQQVVDECLLALGRHYKR